MLITLLKDFLTASTSGRTTTTFKQLLTIPGKDSRISIKSQSSKILGPTVSMIPLTLYAIAQLIGKVRIIFIDSLERALLVPT